MDRCINRNENGLCMLFDTFFPEKRPTACNEWGECILDDADFADTNEFEGECEAFEPDTPIMDEEGEEHEPEYDDYLKKSYGEEMKSFDDFYEDAIMTGSFCTPTDSSAQPVGGKLTPSNFIGTNRSRKRKKKILQKRKIY